MRLGGCAAVLVLVACGGSESGPLPDGGSGGSGDDADYSLTDTFVSVVNPNNVACPHPSPLPSVGQARSGRWIDSSAGGSGSGTVSSSGEVDSRFSSGNIGIMHRTAQIHGDGSVTGTLTFTQAACSGTYTTTGHKAN